METCLHYTTRKNKFEIRISHFRANVSNRITNVRLRFVIRVQRPQKTAARQKTGQNVNLTKSGQNVNCQLDKMSTHQQKNVKNIKILKLPYFILSLFDILQHSICISILHLYTIDD